MNNGKIMASSSISDLIKSGKLATVLEESDSQAKYDDIIELAVENFDKINENKDLPHVVELPSATLIDADVENDDEHLTQHKHKPKVLVEEESTSQMSFYRIYLLSIAVVTIAIHFVFSTNNQIFFFF